METYWTDLIGDEIARSLAAACWQAAYLPWLVAAFALLGTLFVVVARRVKGAACLSWGMAALFSYFLALAFLSVALVAYQRTTLDDAAWRAVIVERISGGL